MIFETPRPCHIIALPTPMDEDDLDLPCPPAPYLPSCSNFHSPSPVSLSQHRFRFTQSLDADCETPVFQQVYTGGLGFGGNMLGLFIDEKDMEKGVLQAAIERIEYDSRYSSVFEEEDEYDMCYDLGSPPSSPPALMRRGSGYTSSDVSSTGELSPPISMSSWHNKSLVCEDLKDDVEILQQGMEMDRDLRSDEDEISFDSSSNPMAWRIPAYLREPDSSCTSSASTPSFCSLTPVPYDTMYSYSTVDAYPGADHAENLSTSLESLSVPSARTRRPDGEGPAKRRKLEHRSARIINGSLFS